MKNRFKYVLIAVLIISFCSVFFGCGKSVKQEVYTGDILISEDHIVPIEMIIDENDIFTLTSINGDGLPLGFLGLPKDGLGGKVEKVGNNYTFVQLNGDEIATAVLKKDTLMVNYGNLTINLQKSEKSYKAENEHGGYTGYVNDGRPFEVCFVLRPENKWYIIEEDGDINSYGVYNLDRSMITLTEDGETEKYAFGTVNGDKIVLNLDDDIINFQKIK